MSVSPCACGGTDMDINRFDDEAGLSPRVRGNLRATALANRASGSIPPRVRGNHREHGAQAPEAGSIPRACGEPCSTIVASATLPVYPRACGGTAKRRSCARGAVLYAEFVLDAVCREVARRGWRLVPLSHRLAVRPRQETASSIGSATSMPSRFTSCSLRASSRRLGVVVCVSPTQWRLPQRRSSSNRPKVSAPF